MNSINKTSIITLIEEFRRFGVIKAGDLCLPPNIALKFLDRLEYLGIGILGLDGWRFTGEKGVIQDLETDVSIPENILSNPDSVEISIELARDYIQTRLKKDVDLVSFTLNVPFLWKDLFPGK